MVFEDLISSITNRTNVAPSSLNFKYPTWRDFPLRSVEIWLEGKREDDGAENLWRIHDGLYDLNNFIKSHPGGPLWIKYTQGTDITEAFEVHHISTTPKKMLSQFFVRKASTPRNSPFTFKEDEFYKTLKRNIQEVLKDLPKWPVKRSQIITDFLLFFYISFSIMAAYTWSFALGAIAGVLLNCTIIAAHNYFHQRDNFRMYYFDFSLMSSKAWRVSHALSHHMYTNTIKDLEISIFEPFLQYLPQEKNFFFRYLSWLYSPIVYSVIFFISWLTEFVQRIWSRKGFVLPQLLPLVIPLLMYVFTTHQIHWIFLMYIWILICGSFFFGVIGLNAAHHHPDIFHDGDTPRSRDQLDWGIHQMDAVMDRYDITGSHFLVLTNFGDHALHHLFPTIDHGLLEYLYPVFQKTCEQFGIDIRITSQLELIRGQFKQLARIQPTTEPRKPLKQRIK